MWGADRINIIYPPMNLCPGGGEQTLTYSTAPTAPHNREQNYARIRLVFDGRTDGCTALFPEPRMFYREWLHH